MATSSFQEEPTYFPAKEEQEADDPSTNLMAALDDLLPQGVPNATRYELDLDPMAGLEALLGESVKVRAEEEQYKKDREARKRGYHGLSKEEVEFCNSRMHAFEMAREWEVVECISVWTQFRCVHCNTVQMVFSRLMEHHQHRRLHHTRRWQTVLSTKIESADIVPVIEDRIVPFCEDCVVEQATMLPPDNDSPYLEAVLGTEPVQE